MSCNLNYEGAARSFPDRGHSGHTGPEAEASLNRVGERAQREEVNRGQTHRAL